MFISPEFFIAIMFIDNLGWFVRGTQESEEIQIPEGLFGFSRF